MYDGRMLKPLKPRLRECNRPVWDVCLVFEQVQVQCLIAILVGNLHCSARMEGYFYESAELSAS